MMMKLIIQIPCFNEEKTLAHTLSCLPRSLEGVDTVEWLVVDDGSRDNTVKIAKENGVDHIVSFAQNKGLAAGFISGLDACLRLGADIIVNTDADNQYCADDIPVLLKPILDKKADYVIGSRPISTIEHFSGVKKFFQRLGSLVVRVVSGTEVPDAPSGFRAMTRETAMRLNVFNKYTYTLETIIQAGHSKKAILSVPVRVNEDLRPSKLVKSLPAYIRKSAFTIIRIFVVYKSFRFFFSIGLSLFLIGLVIGGRFLYHYLTDNGDGHVQSLILCSVLLVIGFQTMLTAFIADLLAVNRHLLEDIKFRVRKLEVDS